MKNNQTLFKSQIIRFLISITLASSSSVVFAWGDVGHMTVCELAMSQVTPTTKSAILKITDNRPLNLECIWPDQVKRIGNWYKTSGYHFINLEEGSGWTPSDQVTSKKDGKTYTFANVGDMVQMIEHSKDKLISGSLTANQKLCHLRFLAHLTGDAHQPLHVGRKADAGGNAIAVTFNADPLYKLRIFGFERDANGEMIQNDCAKQVFTPSLKCMMSQTILEKKADGSVGPLSNNLHIMWDDGFIDQRVKEVGHFSAEQFDKRATPDAFQAYLKDISPAFASRRSELQSSMSDDSMRWLEITSAHQKFAYSLDGVENSQGFYKARIPLVNDQIIRAGYHLAGTLNMIFDPSFKINPYVQVFNEKRTLELKARIKAGRSTEFKTECDENI